MSHILVLHPGEMGSSLAACLKKNNHQVSWVAADRSHATLQRAKHEGLINLGRIQNALNQADIVLSICPPEYAEDQAKMVANAEFEGLYVDANATSPITAARIAKTFGTDYVDGSVIGPPARSADRTRLYLSGEKAQTICDLFGGTFANPQVISEQETAASALKMCYAGYTKGTSALLINLCALAEAHGVSDALLEEWSVSQPDLEARCERTGPGVSRKAWRFAGEMREIAATFKAKDLPDKFHKGAADLYERLADFKERPAASTAELVRALLKD